jgi:hypothetical protein
MRLRALRGLSLVGLLAGAASCGGEPSGPSEPTALEFVAGQGQQGQVGAPLAAAIVLKASNRKGPVPGVVVSVATESQGGGTVSPPSATTAADGTAQFTWTLGSKIGTQTLTATFSGTTTVTATLTAIATAGPASVVIATSQTFQFVVVGRAVSTLPAVQVTDGFGNPIAGVPVTFQALQPGSVLSGVSPTTNAQGTATLGGWTIGPNAQNYTVQASIPGGAAVQFIARGIPAALTAVAGTGQTANAGTAVPVVPAVRATRDDGSPLANVPVDFSVAAGGGSVVGGGVTTGADGIARPTRWVLGLNPGPNRLIATTSGGPSVSFDATGVAATPAQVVPGNTTLSGFFGNYLIANPEVTVLDAQGNPVAGVTVGFQVTAGGGRVTQPAGLTDFQGKAATTSWRLGPAGPQTVSATVGALPPVTFTAQGSDPPASTFRLDVRYATGTSPTPAQQAAFDAAAARWKALILSGAPPYQVVATDIDPSGDCPSLLGEVVDGVVIHVRIQNLGNANILGATGLCVIRDQGFLPVQAIMFLNTTALANLEANGLLTPVILHEMGHALGFGTLWSISIPGLGSIQLIQGGGSCSAPAANPTFSGLAARAAFYGSVTDGSAFTGTPIPIENTGGCGTAYSHWRKTTFGPELLTGFLTMGVATPLSAMTVQSLRDVGYVVNDAPADTYSFQAFLQGLSLARLALVEDPALLTGPITVINRSGRTVARIPRALK